MIPLATQSADTAKTDPTHPIPESAQSFELVTAIKLLKDGAQFRATGHAARTLFKSPSLRIVLIVLRRDEELKEHKTNAPAALHVLEGSIRVALPDRSVEPVTGSLVVIEPGVPHDVIALSDSAFILSMPWGGQKDLAGTV